MLPSLYKRVRSCAHRAELSVSKWLQLAIERAVRIDEKGKSR